MHRLKSLISNDFFYSNQFGFLKTRTTEVAIIHYVTESLDNGNIAAACLLDATPLKWFKSYLLDRKQWVLVGSTFSNSTADENIGVIQGSF